MTGPRPYSPDNPFATPAGPQGAAGPATYSDDNPFAPKAAAPAVPVAPTVRLKAPTFPIAAAEATRTGAAPANAQAIKQTGAAKFGSQVFQAGAGMLERGPMLPIDLAAAPAEAAATGAKFIAQSAAETTLPDDQRAHALADPERISEKQAAFAAAQLALTPVPGISVGGKTLMEGGKMLGGRLAEGVAGGVAAKLEPYATTPAAAAAASGIAGAVGHGVAGAAIGASYSPDNPFVGAALGGVAGAVHGAMGGPPVRVNTPEVPQPIGAERQLPPGTPPTASATMADAPGTPPTPRPAPVEAEAELVQPSTLPSGTEAPKSLPRLRAGGKTKAADIEGVAPTAAPAPHEPGAPTDVILGDGQKLPATFAVMSADDLKPSHNPFTFQPTPGYPEGVQGRDYHRNIASQTTVQMRAMDYNPDIALNPSTSAAEGAPTVLPNGVVLAGNERSMLPQLAAVHAPGRYDEYVAQMKSRAAQFGLDPAQIDRVKNPVLVRVLTNPRDTGNNPQRWADINRLSDQVITKDKSSTEAGAARAAKLRHATDALDHFASTIDPEQTLNEYLTGPHGATFGRKLVTDGVITPAELSSMMGAQGNLTVKARQAVGDMLLATAVTDPAVIEDAPAMALDKLARAVPAIVSVRGSSYDISEDVTKALRELAAASAHGMKLAAYRAQPILLGKSVATTPRSEAIAASLEKLTPTKVKEAFRKYGALAGEAIREQETGAGDMFGGTQMTPETAFARAFGGESDVVREGGAEYQMTPQGQTFTERLYSRIDRAIEAAPFKKGTADQWRAHLAKGVSAAEREWTGIDTLLAAHPTGTITQEEVARTARENRIALEETTLADPQPNDDFGADNPTKYRQWKSPGGKNYKERILSLSRPDDPAQYQDPHWPGIENPVVHIRTQEYTTPQDGRVLLGDEIQSGWNQAGRKKGYDTDALKAQRDAEDDRIRAINAEVDKLWQDVFFRANGQPDPDKFEVAAAQARLNALDIEKKSIQEHQRKRGNNQVADNPFKATTAWAELGLKALLDDAVHGGFDRVVISNGAINADRYNLRKAVDEIHYNAETGHFEASKNGHSVHSGNYDPKALEAVIGKEAAERLMAQEPARVDLAKIQEAKDERDRAQADIIAARTKISALEDGSEELRLGLGREVWNRLQQEGNLGFDSTSAARVAVLNHDNWNQLFDTGFEPEMVQKVEEWRRLTKDQFRQPHIELHKQEMAAVDRRERAEMRIRSLTNSQGKRTLSGEQLEIGGKGMMQFYDTLIPRTLKDYFKSLKVSIPFERSTVGVDDATKGTNLSFPVTPELRAAIAGGQRVLERGPDLFGAPDPAEEPADLFGGATKAGARSTAPQGMTDALTRARDVVNRFDEQARAKAGKPSLAYREATALLARQEKIGGGELEARAQDLRGAAGAGQAEAPSAGPEQQSLFERGKKTPIDQAQVDLWAATPPAETATITYGSPKASFEAAQRTMMIAGRHAVVTFDAKRPSVDMRETALQTPPSNPRNIPTRERDQIGNLTARVDIVGQIVKDLQDLHEVLMPFRDPRAEHLGILLIDPATHQIVRHVLTTSGHLTQVGVAIDQTVHDILTDYDHFGKPLEVWLHHNHPSGDPQPSDEDRSVTVDFANALKMGALLSHKPVTFGGHYVIDHTKGTVLTVEPAGARQLPGVGQTSRPMSGGVFMLSELPVRARPEATTGPDWLNHAPGYIRPGDESGLADVVRVADPKGGVHLVFVDAQGRIVALDVVDSSAFSQMPDGKLTQMAAALGAARVHVAAAREIVQPRWFRMEMQRQGDAVNGLFAVTWGPDDIPTMTMLTATPKQQPAKLDINTEFVHEPGAGYGGPGGAGGGGGMRPPGSSGGSGAQEPDPNTPAGRAGLVPGVNTALHKASDFFSTAFQDALASARRLDPAYAEAGDYALAARPFAGHFARTMARWTDEGLTPEQSHTLSRVQIIGRLEELNDREDSGQLSFIPDDAGARAQRDKTIARYRAMVPPGFLHDPAVQRALARRMQIYADVMEHEAVDANVSAASFSQAATGHIKLVPVRPEGDLSAAISGSRPLGTQTAQAAKQAEGTALDYETDWEKVLASDARDKFVKAARNRFIRATILRGRPTEPGEVLKKGEVRVTMDDPAQQVGMGPRISVVVPKAIGQAYGHVDKFLTNKGAATDDVSAFMRLLDRTAGQVVFTANPAALISHARNMANAVASAPEAGQIGWLKAAAGMVPGAKRTTGTIEIAAVNMQTPEARALRMRLAKIGALRPLEQSMSGLGERFERAKKGALQRLRASVSPAVVRQIEKLSVFGENGIDERGRVALAQKFLRQKPDATDGELGQYVNRMAGGYTRGAGGVAVQALQGARLAMFARIETAKLGLGIRGMVGKSMLPAKSHAQAAELGIKQLMLGPWGNKAGLAAAIAAVSMLLGRKLMQAPGKENDLPTGKTDDQGREIYISGRFLSPSDAVTQDLGIDAAARGDTRGALNALTNTALRISTSHPFARAGFAAALGAQPSLDREGKLRPLGSPTLSGLPRLSTIGKVAADMTSISPLVRESQPNPGLSNATGRALAFGGANVRTAAAPADVAAQGLARQDAKAWMDAQTSELFRAPSGEARAKVLAAALDELETASERNPALGTALQKLKARAVLQRAAGRAAARRP